MTIKYTVIMKCKIKPRMFAVATLLGRIGIMERLKIVLFLCILGFLPIGVFAQEPETTNPNVEFKRNPDGGISSIIMKKAPVFTDAEGNVVSQQEQDAFLETNMNYAKRIRIEPDQVIVFIDKIIPDNFDDIIGQDLPTLTYSDLDGNEIKIVDRETPFLLCFWDTHCGNCFVEIQILNWIADEFPGLRIIAITPDELAVVKTFMEEKKYSWKNVTVVTDYQEEYLPIIQSKVHPTTVLVSKSGVIEKLYIGNQMRQMVVDMDKYLQNLDLATP